MLPEDAEFNFDTKLHVNHQATKSWTRAGGSNLVEDISSQYMEGDTIHPAVILYTDQGGAGEDVQVENDIFQHGNEFKQTDGNEGYDYATAETLEASNFNWAIINKDVKLIANIKLTQKPMRA